MKKLFYKIYIKEFILSTLIGLSYGFAQLYISSKLALFFEKATLGDKYFLTKNAFNFMLILFLIVSLKFAGEVYVNRKRSRNKYIFKKSIYDRFLENSYKNVEAKTFGEISIRLQKDVEKIINNLDNDFSIIIYSTLSLLVYFVYLFFINKTVTLIIFIVSSISLISPIIFRKRYKFNYETYNFIEEKISSLLNETLEGFEFIKTNNMYNHYEDEYFKLQSDVSNIAINLEKNSALEDSLNVFLNNFSKFSIYGTLGLFIMNKQISIGNTVQFIFMSKLISNSMGSIFDKYHNTQNCNISIKRIEEIFDNTNNKNEIVQINEVKKIEFNNVSFSHDNSKMILENASFIINDGNKILIKGKNGSGKSTLLKLILGLYNSMEGIVKINDNNIVNIDIKSYYNNIAYLPQDQVFFTEDIFYNLNILNENNIEYLNYYLDRFDLIEEDIKEKKCNEISGGQKQKISIIRTMISKKQLIILDEPTNYLDKLSIDRLKEIIVKYNGIVIVISHDNLFDGLFDKIIYLNDGKIKIEDSRSLKS